MNSLYLRRASFRQTASAPAPRRAHIVRVSAAAVQAKSNNTSAALAAAATAAMLLMSSNAIAAPEVSLMTNPQAELAVGPRTKGSLAPDSAGQESAGRPGKALEVKRHKGSWIAANKQDQEEAATKYPSSRVNWRRGFEGQ